MLGVTLSVTANAVPPPPRGGGLGKEGKFRPHSLTAGRNQPITGKLSALAKGSPLGRAGERSEPERVRAESNPLRQRLLALPPPPKVEALAKRVSFVLIR